MRGLERVQPSPGVGPSRRAVLGTSAGLTSSGEGGGSEEQPGVLSVCPDSAGGIDYQKPLSEQDSSILRGTGYEPLVAMGRRALGRRFRRGRVVGPGQEGCRQEGRGQEGR